MGIRITTTEEFKIKATQVHGYQCQEEMLEAGLEAFAQL